MLILLFDVAIGTPPGSGFSGLYQSCCILTVGLKMVEVKVTGLPELQLITWLAGATELVGATVFCPMANVCCVLQPAIPLLAVTVYVPWLPDVKVTAVPPAV
jgi:hypothetical protein